MNQGIVLADIGDVGLVLSAVLVTASVAVYAVRARGPHGRWWRSPVGLHLMCYMVALAWVLDQSVIYMITGPGILVAASPLRPDWFTWERVVSFAALIPAVFAWRLVIILRPPGSGAAHITRRAVMAAQPSPAPVQASTAAAAVSGLVLWVLGTYVFKGVVPDAVASWVYMLVPAAITFGAGYLTHRHLNPPAAPPPAAPPAVPAGPGA